MSTTATPVYLLWAATDGFKNNTQYVKGMGPGYFHFYDYIHVLKNLRNTICNHVVKSPTCGDGFHMNDLIRLRESNPLYQKFLPKDPNPVDKMCMSNVEQLLEDVFLNTLKENSPVLKGLAEYFFYMKMFFSIFDDNQMTFTAKKEIIPEILRYFSDIQQYSKKKIVLEIIYII
eukprot:Pompholyxophrys_punicea_v1_NODE_1034_length_1025_cov_2.761856.p1 type:complete len:174 gc:universal NODE_1034_length_1025_cov_2.761856:804-283(-)